MTLLLAILFAATSSAPESVCAWPEFRKPLAAPVILSATLVPTPHGGDDSLPFYGRGEAARMFVKVRVDAILRGSFPVGPGRSFLLAVHSVVLAFGHDPVGERVELGLAPSGRSDFVLQAVRPSPQALVSALVTVERPASATAPGLVSLGGLPNHYSFVRVREVAPAVTPFAAGALVPLSYWLPDDLPKQPRTLCLLLVHRPSRSEAPFRILRLGSPD